MADNYPFNNFKQENILFSSNLGDEFQIAYGNDRIGKCIVAFRYNKNADNFNHGQVGYPYRYCTNCNDNQKPTKIWVKVPDYMSKEILNLLPKLQHFNDIKNPKIECREKEIQKNRKIRKTNDLPTKINSVENELFEDKFIVIFENDDLQVAMGINKFNKELVIAFRWFINIEENAQDNKGYPYQWCKNKDCPDNKKLVKVWLPLPNYLALDFIDILSKKFENKADFKIKSVVENS